MVDDDKTLFLILSNIVFFGWFVSISIISIGDDDDTNSWCVANDVCCDGETDSWSNEVRVVDDGRLRSRFNAINGRAKS